MASPPSLPSEIWFDHILTRVKSVDSLGLCRVVSKDWNHITYQSRFWQLFCKRSDTVSGFLFQNLHCHKHSSTFVSVDNKANKTLKLSILNFLPAPVKVEAVSSQGGLVFCVNQNHRRVPEYFVCKPTTLQWETLPNPKTRYYTQSNAIVVLSWKPLRYKIIRFSDPESPVKYQPHQTLIRCEVFDSNTWAWKELKHVSFPYSVWLKLPRRPCVTSGGACYWHLTNNQVLAFYYEDDKESWEIFDSPERMSDSEYCAMYTKLVEYQGRLALIYSEGGLMELWVMEDHEKKVWRRHKLISLDGLKQLVGRYPSPEAYYNSDIALMEAWHEVIFYKFDGSSSNKVVKLKRNPDEIFKLQSDFEIVNLRGPWRWRDFSFIFFLFGFSFFCYFVRFLLGL
ncbi:unnamed protein product [Prunus armeniaca]|uniref:F-box associated beta-propeller type 3 domain-containing protein n=1 Tax=Prunus armeniaca TaxID=36596 RepID=A0A6J5XY19_PRUAR|nr:unnamed protein product [Prunus armeniaca]